MLYESTNLTRATENTHARDTRARRERLPPSFLASHLLEASPLDALLRAWLNEENKRDCSQSRSQMCPFFTKSKTQTGENLTVGKHM